MRIQEKKIKFSKSASARSPVQLTFLAKKYLTSEIYDGVETVNSLRFFPLHVDFSAVKTG